MIPLLGFGVEYKKFRHYEAKPKNGCRKMQTRIAILLPFATVQRMHSRSGRLDGELVMREDEHSHEQILITVDSLEQRSNTRSLYG